ncbi:peptidoglycan recognition protein family protein [Brachybacterium alimentarium]|uniref:peptidoglycan recognition protein family protein n=1 Tax=Brachybacterium alimentarium TaxID=47845 RepID=UPI003FD4D185
MARAYTYITKYTSPNQNARNRKIAGITCHWWGTPTGQNVEGIVSWLCDKRAGTSAHYVVSEDTVYCIVDPDRRAWHAGNSKANHTQIGIELDPNASRRASTERTAAALIADLRGTYGNLPLSPHKRWTSTQCPGNWDLGRLDKLARGKQPVAAKPSKPAVSNGKLTEDGRLGTATVKVLQKRLGVTQDGRAGEDTWRALQKLLGTVVDGAVSHQSYRATELGNGVVPRAWRFTGRGSKGSKMVVALQKKVGVKADGVWFEGTTKALQKAINSGKF